ncbi:hypothetical protein F4809DRAFT_644010 [Biscogniauxia mediterranea]|nr:hypothetical protein F4809DRAFT_644010 [Biscogniauxia mediterranea]
MGRSKNRKKEQGRPRSRRNRLRHMRNLDHKESSSQHDSQPSTSTLQKRLDKPTKPGNLRKVQVRLPLDRPGFLFRNRIHVLCDSNLINLIKSLGLEQFWGKSRPRLNALLFESFRLAYDIRSRYPAKDATPQAHIAFFTEIANEIKATGINGGDFLYHHKLEPERNPMGTKNPGDLSILTPDAIMGIMHVYINARRAFKDHRMDKEQHIVLRRKGESTTGAPHDDHDDSDNDEHNNDTEFVIEEVEEEEGLFVPSDSDEEKPRMTKKEKRLVLLVDRWIEWLEQEQGNAVDPSLMKGLSNFLSNANSNVSLVHYVDVFDTLSRGPS